MREFLRGRGVWMGFLCKQRWVFFIQCCFRLINAHSNINTAAKHKEQVEEEEETQPYNIKDFEKKNTLV